MVFNGNEKRNVSNRSNSHLKRSMLSEKNCNHHLKVNLGFFNQSLGPSLQVADTCKGPTNFQNVLKIANVSIFGHSRIVITI